VSEWKAPYEHRSLQHFVDPRGALFEMLRFTDQQVPGGGQIYVFTIAPGARRGDHFHETKQEWFSCALGQVRVLLEPKDLPSVEVILNADQPSVVYAAPTTSHALINDGETVAVVVAYSSTQHHHEAPDTFRKAVSPVSSR
jgi:oxalate decarboxylase/phosphoglucose isomerase-like protein (cupin superfamily)